MGVPENVARLIQGRWGALIMIRSVYPNSIRNFDDSSTGGGDMTHVLLLPWTPPKSRAILGEQLMLLRGGLSSPYQYLLPNASYSAEHRGGNNDGGGLKLGTNLSYMLGNIVQVLFWFSPECVIQGRTLFVGEGEEEEDKLTEPSPEQLSSKFLLDNIEEIWGIYIQSLVYCQSPPPCL
ncbi:hypothetical protein BC629DRAFT_1439912 [Irpex lacteus]|nr:hypothetical protein BC629DRAFT_1439912 [Irpex lacteus]